MPEKFNIRLTIAGKSYPLTIERKHEEKYRRAEREVNELVALYKTRFRAEPEDYLAMVALQLSVNNVETEMARYLHDDDDIGKLEALEALLDAHLDK